MEKTYCGKGGRILRLALALIIVTTGVFGIFASNANRAYAVDSAYLEVGGVIPYAGYSTNWMDCDGFMAYCGNPSESTPASGTYTRSAIDAPSGRNSETAADLWFGYGSPGFDASMWPGTWYDGSAMTDARYVALAHILLSDTFSSDGEAALYGCNQSFKDWARMYVIGFGSDGSEINPNATGRVICARQGELPSNFYPYMLYTGGYTQLVLSFEYVPYGAMELTKQSGNTGVSAGNACYSLAGAVYGVYNNSSCTSLKTTMTTNADGYAYAGEIEPGGYWVREISASPGYALDGSVYPVTVAGNVTTPVNGGIVYDLPQNDPVGMLVGKIDATTNANRPEGAASLEGAEFTLSYYDGYYASADEAVASGAPTRMWVFATDVDGFAYYADAYLVAGGDLYHAGNGTATLPLGTITVEETKAPTGYNLDDGNHGAPDAFCIQITSGGLIGESVYTYNSPAIPDTVQRGDYRLMKEVPTNNDEENQELTRIAIEGVQFQIVNDNEGAVVSPDTLEEVTTGGIVTTLETDENGFASTKTHVPDGWTAALAYGSYTVHEVIPDDVAARVLEEHGITLIGVEDWKITISAEEQYDPVQIVANHIPQTPITIVKLDSTTGRVIPLACSFQLYDADGDLVTYTDHMNEVVIDTWTTIGEGHVTLPMKLDERTYTLREVQAPDGYVLGLEDVTFAVDMYRTWEDPIVIEYEDAPIMGRIVVAKADADTAEMTAGADYCVKAAADIVTGDGTVRATEGQTMAHITTGPDGTAMVEDLFLGSYIVYETKAPEGFALDTAEHAVTLVSEGQTVPVVTHELDCIDHPTELQILKVDATDATKTLEGAAFRIWQDAPEQDDGELAVERVFAAARATAAPYDETFETDEDGLIIAGYLPHGSYHIEELEAPDGYFIPDDADPIDFIVDDQGFIELDVEGAQCSDTLELTFENVPTIVDITKADLTTDTKLPGATLVLTDVEGSEIESWVSATEPHRITGLAPGGYTLTETIAPEGYLLTTAVDFAVEETGEVQQVVMYDDYTKTDISKTDITTGKELAGAHLQVIDAEGTVVAEWDTDGTAHRIDGLVPGDYILRETSAPDGYDIAEDVTFTVQPNDDIQKVVMKDSPTPTPTPSGGIPKMGDSFPWWIGALALGAISAAGAAFALARKMGKGHEGDEESVDADNLEADIE